MPIVSSGVYSNPQVGSIVSNLATAIYGDPETRMKRDYYDAESEAARARAGKANAETAGVYQKNAAVTGLGSVFDGPGTPAENFRANFSKAAPLILQAGGGNADELTKGLGGLFSNYYGLGDVNDQGRSLVLQGKMPDQNFAPTVERADAVAARNGDISRREKVDVENIKAGADRDVAHINNNGALDRVWAAPVVAKRGEDTYLAPNDPRRASIGTDGVVHGAPTVDGLRADAGAQILALPEGQAPSSNLANVFSGGAGYKGATAARPAAVTGKAINDAIMAGAAMVKGATTIQPNGKVTLDGGFEASFPPEKVVAARNAAGAVLSQTRDAQKAGAAYLEALGVQPGAEFGSQGGFLGIGSHKGILPDSNLPSIDAPAAPAVPASPMAAPAKPAQTAQPPQLPPPAQRPVGLTIDSPRGRVTWTGTGWRPAAAERVY